MLEAKRVMVGEASISERTVVFRGPVGRAERAERKRIVGVVARARSKAILIILGVVRWVKVMDGKGTYISASSAHLESISLKLMLRNVHPISAATAFAMWLFPVPGGP